MNRLLWVLTLLLVGCVSFPGNLFAAEDTSPENKLRIVVFGAHCDDPETGAGGLIALLTQAGHEVICAYAATHRADRMIESEPEDAVRRRESAAACNVLGAKPYFFPYDAARLRADEATAKTTPEWLASVKPDIVIAHWPLDTHANHYVVGSLTWQGYQHEGGWTLYFYEVYTAIQSLSFRPNLYVDVEPVIDIKKKAIDCFVSQKPGELWKAHEGMHYRRGEECGCTRAEAYFLVEAKPGAPLLPVRTMSRDAKRPVNGFARSRIEEKLDRGLVAMPMEGGKVYVGWRLLKSDPGSIAFDVYRVSDSDAPLKLNAEPVRKTTDFVDASAPVDRDNMYWVRPLVGGTAQEPSKRVMVKRGTGVQPYISIKLNGDHAFQKIGIGDLDGDGSYDFVLKQPNANIDPYEQYWKASPDTYKIEAYLHDGTFLWRKDLGWAIEQGIWYSPYVVYDFDGDGKAEVAIKTGEGDPRDTEGRVQCGPEYLSIWDGMTGEEKTRVAWHDRMGRYNYSSRNQLGVAYLDGKTPCLLMARGTYTIMKLTAFQYHAGALERLWDWSSKDETDAYWGQGAHFMHCADVDDDGRDEVILGSCVIDDNGRGLWSTGLGHPDHCYVGEIDPTHPGLEIYYGIERSNPKNSVCLVDARTGGILWGIDERTFHVHAQGLCSDIDARRPGQECYSGEKEMPKDKPRRWLHAANGELLATEDTCDLGLAPRAVYWDADLQREVVRDNRIQDFETGATLMEAVEGSEAAWADVLGDWREEIITSVPGELRIYTTTIPAADRRVCLMQDPIYRLDVAHLAMGYPQPPMTGKEGEVK
jgi:LmbE family N-acetylglucosaminyl deacetylase